MNDQWQRALLKRELTFSLHNNRKLLLVLLISLNKKENLRTIDK